MNVNWPRWIKASIGQHFQTAMDPIAFHLEGIGDPELLPLERIEVQVDGPNVSEKLASEYWLNVYVNLLLVTEPKETDIMYHEKMFGLALEAFQKGIFVYKYGNQPDDNPSESIGCLQLVSDLRTTKFDGPRPVTSYASAIDAEYKILL